MALTELQIKHLKPKAKMYRVNDGDGLSLEVTTKGSKLWRFRYRHNGKPQMISLGKYPSVTLAEARKKRDEARRLADTGKNVTREKQAEKLRQAHDGKNTFKNVALRFMDKRDGELNAKYHTQTLARLEQHVFPAIGKLPISEITIPDVVRAIERIIDHGTIETAKRMKQTVSQIFRYAAQRGLCEQNPAADLKDIFPKVQEKHHTCIHPSELPELMRAINDRQPDMSKYAMQLLALTFVRTNELIAAKWEEIDWEQAEWHIPAERMKMKRPHMVPLATQTIAALKELQNITGNREHIFHSGASKSRHISNGTVLMALRRMGYQGKMTGHGFRTLASTILNEQGYQPDVIERQLAHAEKDKIRDAYNRAEYISERTKMMQDYADYLKGAARSCNSLMKIKH